jgi:hypothetical protein
MYNATPLGIANAMVVSRTYQSADVQTEDSGKCAGAEYLSKTLKKKSTVIDLEAMALLGQELQEAKKKMELLEGANKALSSKMCIYHMNWINES